ncbi:hypothetical protein OPT61_g2320 [Boeremia exigua]|uniref:Uncharacterized protein n=1 Tax=Boeremia exigua TaxID=749465 RepID=A0ACC2IM10_9PLEO|nr:hypothetical protein OPT61_g2320 [Boeremia exigua]
MEYTIRNTQGGYCYDPTLSAIHPLKAVAFAGEHGDDAIGYFRCRVSNAFCFLTTPADKGSSDVILGIVSHAYACFEDWAVGLSVARRERDMQRRQKLGPEVLGTVTHLGIVLRK